MRKSTKTQNKPKTGEKKSDQALTPQNGWESLSDPYATTKSKAAKIKVGEPKEVVTPSAQISPYNDPSIILSDPKYRTLFVGDLPHGLTVDEFQPYFEQFGKI